MPDSSCKHCGACPNHIRCSCCNHCRHCGLPMATFAPPYFNTPLVWPPQIYPYTVSTSTHTPVPDMQGGQ